MRALAAVVLCGLLAACAGRPVEVSTGPESTQASVALRVTNSLAQPVNVYVVANGTELFVRQVSASATEQFAVQGVAPGSTVTLRARQVDGRQVYERAGVVLQGGVIEWRVP